MRAHSKIAATCAVAAVSAVSLAGIPAAQAKIVDEPISNEFVTDTAGTDMFEYVEMLVPEEYGTSDLHIIGLNSATSTSRLRSVLQKLQLLS